jgi:hypothetical protein
MKTILAYVLLLLLLAGCTDSVHLRHVTSGQMAQCGPYVTLGVADTLAAVDRERGCVMDYQRQGYERVMR